MTAVKIKASFSKTERDSNGLEDISHEIVKKEFERFTVVGIVEQHKVTKEPGEAPIPTIRFIAIEPVSGDDEATAKQLLDRARKSRGLSDIADTLFDAPRDGYDFDGPGGEGGAELDGQMEIRMGPDGEHEVPPPSAAELEAEEREAQEAGVPAAEFSGSDQ